MPKENKTMTSEEYAKKHGAYCPACGTRDICAEAHTNSQSDDNYATVPANCEECGSEWEDIYTLSGYKDLEGGSKKIKIEVSTSEKHAQKGGAECPACESKTLNPSCHFEADDNYLDRHVECESCGSSWEDTYTLTGYTNSDFKPSP